MTWQPGAVSSAGLFTRDMGWVVSISSERCEVRETASASDPAVRGSSSSACLFTGDVVGRAGSENRCARETACCGLVLPLPRRSPYSAEMGTRFIG